MNLVDTSPLVALIDSGQGKHQECVSVVAKLAGPMLTTVPCFTEAMYLLGRVRGWPGQRMLWRLSESGALFIHRADSNEHRRMRVLMEKYQDTPMDLADASLVAAAEHLGLKRVFTLDSDFYVYRINDRDAFEVIP
ncbi:MAG: PIN domain nuclease [Leptolyngbya foveolarum]|uniref:PIN domain nuclease n=1 Tax=Leptolyngbya foveolarum TaxID=47253 RepID=A0A2W4UIH3_9CYAN|nr:MAG: PIN domain nuclease [Leptolyngbya foveolarum]